MIKICVICLLFVSIIIYDFVVTTSKRDYEYFDDLS